MQTDQDQVLPVWRKPQPAPLSRIISKCTFQTFSEASWGVGNAFRCDTSPVSCPLPSTPALFHVTLQREQWEIWTKEDPWKVSSLQVQGEDTAPAVVSRGQKQGTEQCCWILIDGHYQRSLSNASPLMKRWLFLPGVSLNHKLEQVKMHRNENRERGAPAGPLWDLLGPPLSPAAGILPQLTKE